MRVFDLINLGSWYLKMGIMAALFVMFCIFTGYFVVYRKLLKGQRKIIWKQFLWWGILICYLYVVFGATLFSRGSDWSSSKIEPLFYSYKDAWIHFSNAAWRNIVLNFCMFIPFGLWLPLGIKRLRRFWKIYLAGFGFSLLIECMQLFLKRGMFELDDIMGNTVGTMIGYGLFAIGYFLVNRKERKYPKGIFVVLFQMPLLLTVAAFAVIFWKYDKQELGNNPYSYMKAYDSTMIHMTGENTFRTEETVLEVYEVCILTVDSAREKGEQIFEALDTATDESRTDVYDETIVMYSVGGNYSLWIDYQGGTLGLTNFGVLYPDDHATPEPATGADEIEIRYALCAMGFEVPKEAAFRELEAGAYQFDAAMTDTDDGIVNGFLKCKYFGEKKGIGQISDNLITCTPYKNYVAISEQEAYERIVRGEFAYEGNAYLEIQVESCSLTYALDSKGYYQPNYEFKCTINEEESEIIIPAIKN